MAILQTFLPIFCQLYEYLLKFIYSEKATKFCEIFTLLLTGTTQDKSKVKISQNFVTFSEYMNFTNVLSVPLFSEFLTRNHPSESGNVEFKMSLPVYIVYS